MLGDNRISITQTFRHCDDYIDDPTQPEVLRKFLDRARSPAHGMLDKTPAPQLFATYRGKRYRVTMASRLGDVGLNEDFAKDHGYSIRTAIEDLSQFSDRPK